MAAPAQMILRNEPAQEVLRSYAGLRLMPYERSVATCLLNLNFFQKYFDCLFSALVKISFVDSVA